MATVPTVRYARSSGSSLAYQVFGDGPPLLVIPGFAQNVEMAWEQPEFRDFFERVAAVNTVVHFDKRGTGASDRTIPVAALDARVDDARSVMDAAGLDRAFIYGVSEGGPMAMLFAATYPDRTDGLILDSTAAVLVPPDLSAEEREARRQGIELLLERWGTDDTLTLDIFAPTLAHDPSYRGWQPRYERQSASPAALRELIEMIDDIDVREVLPSIRVPTIARHRTGDPIVPVQLARDTVAAIEGATLLEFDGNDHFGYFGPDVVPWLDAVRVFTKSSRVPAGARRRHVNVAIRTLGGFSVSVDGDEVPTSEWGSRRARQLCKRLAAAEGNPIPRDQLIDGLWPDDVGAERLGARLSVQLSTVRRILGGGVIADRASIRLDRHHVAVDVTELHEASRRHDHRRVLHLFCGDFLPEDLYEDWTLSPRARARSAFVESARKLATAAEADNRHDHVIEIIQRLLDLDPYDDDAHRRVIRAFAKRGRLGEARRAHETYANRMAELGVRAESLAAFVPRSDDDDEGPGRRAPRAKR